MQKPLNFYTCGAGFPLIILHGLFGSSDNWQTLSRSFKERFTVYAVDLRNHGNSPHDDAFDYEVMAADLGGFMDEHQLPHAHVLGHSMGGKVAMQFASSSPKRVSKLIIADIAPKDYPPHHNDLLQAMASVNLSACGSRSDVDQALAPKIPDAAVRQFLLKSVTRDEAGGCRWKINLSSIQANYPKIAAAPPLVAPFAGPTLFIRGAQSNYIQPEDEPGIRRWFPNSEIATVEGAGHWLHAEKPSEFFRTAMDFFK